METGHSTGVHRFLAGVDAGCSRVFDPLLATFGVPADGRMDGRALPIVDPTGARRYLAYEHVTAEPAADEAVEVHLENPCYLERP